MNRPPATGARLKSNGPATRRSDQVLPSADVASHAYNPRGRTAPSSYRFPFPDRAFDFIFLASVFTHMMPDDVEHYVRELSRMLAPGGKCVVSFFLLNDETRAGVEAGRSFMSFGVCHPSGVCRLHDASVPEAAVAFEESFVRKAHEQAGLHIEDVRRGRWWTGERHDQDVLTVVRQPESSLAGRRVDLNAGCGAGGRSCPRRR